MLIGLANAVNQSKKHSDYNDCVFSTPGGISEKGLGESTNDDDQKAHHVMLNHLEIIRAEKKKRDGIFIKF